MTEPTRHFEAGIRQTGALKSLAMSACSVHQCWRMDRTDAD